MARLEFLIVFLLILTVARVRTLDLEDYGDMDDNNELPESDYADFSPEQPPKSLLASDSWPSNDEGESVENRGPISAFVPDFVEEERSPEPPIKKRPISKRRSLRIKARAATADELQQLFGDRPRRKKSVKTPKTSLFRQYLKSALQHSHTSVKKKRSVERKRTVQKRSGLRKKRPFKDDDEQETEKPSSSASEDDDRVQKLELVNTLLSQENGFLTAALNQATVAQTNGNKEETVREEIQQIQNAEKIEAIMRQLERDEASVKEAQEKNEDPGDLEETVMVTRTSVADLASCPVVKKLSTGCSRVAAEFDFEMDEDASDACDEHRICYSCSSAFSASRNLCDSLFIEQSRQLCTKEEDGNQCNAEARELLQAMQQTHLREFEASSQLEDVCRNPCVKDYFRAVYRSRR